MTLDHCKEGTDVNRWNFIIVLMGCLFMHACAVSPIMADRMPVLNPGEGMVGISFDSPSVELTSVIFDSASGAGKKLRISEVPIGQSVFLFVASAGRYCLERRTLTENGISVPREQESPCFDIEAGKVSYGGTLFLSFDKSQLLSGMHHLNGSLTRENRIQIFLDMTNHSYPHIAPSFSAVSDHP